MGNLARKIIDAVQNLMLDTLLPRLLSLWWIALFWDHLHEPGATGVMSLMLFPIFSLFVVAWVLGAVANGRPRPAESVQKRPSNGFEAWSEPPAGGLNPPAWLRVVVLTLGRRRVSDGWIGLASFILSFVAIALLWLLTYRPEGSWIDLQPMLADRSARDALWLGAATLVLLFMLRHWAIQQRLRLEPEEGPRSSPVSPWFEYVALSILVVGLIGVPSLIFRWPEWITAVAVFAVAIVAFVPGWRSAFLDAMFGKRLEPETSGSNEPAP